jgi:predicted nucleotidyltransferase
VIEQKYIDYWRDRQTQEQQYHQKLAEQARHEAQQITDFLVQQYPVQLTRDRFRTESDIDLAVEGLPSAKYFEILAQVNRLAFRWVDLKLWEDLEPYFQTRVLATGEVLYERP